MIWISKGLCPSLCPLAWRVRPASSQVTCPSAPHPPQSRPPPGPSFWGPPPASLGLCIARPVFVSGSFWASLSRHLCLSLTRARAERPGRQEPRGLAGQGRMPLGQAQWWGAPRPPGHPRLLRGQDSLAGAERGPRTRQVLGFPCSEDGSWGRWGFSLPWTEPTPGPIMGTLWAGPGWRAPAGRRRARGPETPPQRQPRPAAAPDGVPGESLQHWQGPPAAARSAPSVGDAPNAHCLLLPRAQHQLAPAGTKCGLGATRPSARIPGSQGPGPGPGCGGGGGPGRSGQKEAVWGAGGWRHVHPWEPGGVSSGGWGHSWVAPGARGPQTLQTLTPERWSRALSLRPDG